LTKGAAARNDCAGDLSVTSNLKKRWKFVRFITRHAVLLFEKYLFEIENVSGLCYNLRHKERKTKMKSYSIEDLLVGQFYRPSSLARRFMGGEIDYATKRENVYVGEDYQAFSIRYRVGQSIKRDWATIAVRVAD
jgi:hypothetical protein